MCLGSFDHGMKLWHSESVINFFLKNCIFSVKACCLQFFNIFRDVSSRKCEAEKVKQERKCQAWEQPAKRGRYEESTKPIMILQMVILLLMMMTTLFNSTRWGQASGSQINSSLKTF